MIDINKLQKEEPKILVIGNYPIIQPILDFDFLSGKAEPSIKAIIASGRNYAKHFWGGREIVIPIYESVTDVPKKLKNEINLFLNLSSGRRCYSSTLEVMDYFPNLLGGAIFAEDTPEQFSIDMWNKANEKGIFIVGPSTVGILIPGYLKLGAVGGVRTEQLVDSYLFDKGNVAVFSSSGGMTNELINIVIKSGKRISFALSFGGDRFPITRPVDAFLAAEKDKSTEAIVYFGELGGYDEYDVIELIEKKKITKPIIAYIAGVIGEAFDKPTQFGHAKALAKRGEETAEGKRLALKKAGVIVPNSFSEFVKEVGKIKSKKYSDEKVSMDIINNRSQSLFSTSIIKEPDGEVFILGKELLEQAKTKSFAHIAISMFLGKRIKSKETEEFVDLVLKLLVDHGPNVSGAVNTMITARAGKDLVSSLVTGLLTVGPRFGGAINEAAGNWIRGVEEGKAAKQFIEEFSKAKKYILGIGHRKYRIDFPDPRVAAVMKFTKNLKYKKFTTFAKEIEKITTSKKGNLILNVDGAIAAILLDILHEREGYTIAELKKQVDAELFNAMFVLPRTVGFISHFLDQKRMDEGLFRLPEGMVAEVNI